MPKENKPRAKLVIFGPYGKQSERFLDYNQTLSALVAINQAAIDESDTKPRRARGVCLDSSQSITAYKLYKHGSSIKYISSFYGVGEASVLGAIRRVAAGRYGPVEG